MQARDVMPGMEIVLQDGVTTVTVIRVIDTAEVAGVTLASVEIVWEWQGRERRIVYAPDFEIGLAP